MWRTVLFLIFTLIAVPLLTFFYDVPLNTLQWEALNVLLWIYGIAAGTAFVISTLTNNYSQVDKLWSLMPMPLCVGDGLLRKL